MEHSEETFERLLERLRIAMPAIADQIEAEVGRGRRMAVGSLPERDRQGFDAKLREAGARASKDDLVPIEYAADEKLALLISAVQRIGSSMAASREALLEMLADHPVGTRVRFRDEAAAAEVEVDVAAEARAARAAIDGVVDGLQAALEELK